MKKKLVGLTTAMILLVGWNIAFAFSDNFDDPDFTRAHWYAILGNQEADWKFVDNPFQDNDNLWYVGHSADSSDAAIALNSDYSSAYQKIRAIFQFNPTYTNNSGQTKNSYADLFFGIQPSGNGFFGYYIEIEYLGLTKDGHKFWKLFAGDTTEEHKIEKYFAKDSDTVWFDIDIVTTGNSIDINLYRYFNQARQGEFTTARIEDFVLSDGPLQTGLTGFGTGEENTLTLGYYSINPVPEPTTMLLFGTGLAGLAAIGRRRQN